MWKSWLKMFSGHFSLQVLGASDLPSKYQALNTYVQVKVDDSEIFKTKTSQDSLNPVWNETREFDTKGQTKFLLNYLMKKRKNSLENVRYHLKVYWLNKLKEKR